MMDVHYEYSTRSPISLVIKGGMTQERNDLFCVVSTGPLRATMLNDILLC